MAGVRKKRTQRKKRVNSTSAGRKLKKKNKIRVNVDSKAIRQTWDKSKTLKQNFKDLGLAYNVNNTMPVKNTNDESIEAMEVDKQPKNSVVKELEKEASHGAKTEHHISPGEAKFLWELIQDHGDNYEAMKRDKRNYYQHTAKQLRRKCVKFLNSNQDFSKYLDNPE